MPSMACRRGHQGDKESASQDRYGRWFGRLSYGAATERTTRGRERAETFARFFSEVSSSCRTRSGRGERLAQVERRTTSRVRPRRPRPRPCAVRIERRRGTRTRRCRPSRNTRPRATPRRSRFAKCLVRNPSAPGTHRRPPGALLRQAEAGLAGLLQWCRRRDRQEIVDGTMPRQTAPGHHPSTRQPVTE